jgi:hypothetical protein
MIADKLQQLQTIKDNIKTAINNKGGNVGDDFTTYATAIDNIEGGGGGTGDCTLESITITENGKYYPNEGIDGYNEVIVDVPNNGGTFEEAYEQGKADQKALMTTGVFKSVGTYTREDGWNEVKISINTLLHIA